MKLKKLTLGILAAVAAFILGISAYAAAGFALSFVPTRAAKPEVFERATPNIQHAPETQTPGEPIFVGPSADEDTADGGQYSDEFDPAGEYYLDLETVPNAFADIDYLQIETHDYGHDSDDNPTSSPIAPKGFILTKKALRFDRIAIGGKEITFQTATVKGVSYKFTGSFLTTDYCESDGDMPDLKGRLIKIKDNKWAAEMVAEFYVSCGC